MKFVGKEGEHIGGQGKGGSVGRAADLRKDRKASREATAGQKSTVIYRGITVA